MSTIEERQRHTEGVYRDYYAAKGDDRNNPLDNPGVLFQNLAFERSIVEALRGLNVRKSWTFLDVGCGSGFSLLRLLSCGLEPETMHGIDISDRRIEQGQRRLPALNLRHGDATALDYPGETFDLVMESTIFTQMTDEFAARRIAQEMLRVTKPGQYIMLTDWRYDFGRTGYSALSKARIERLFDAGSKCTIVRRTHGALLPPLGRALSRYAPALYFVVSALFPFLVGQVTTILKKN